MASVFDSEKPKDRIFGRRSLRICSGSGNDSSGKWREVGLESLRQLAHEAVDERRPEQGPRRALFPTPVLEYTFQTGESKSRVWDRLGRDVFQQRCGVVQNSFSLLVTSLSRRGSKQETREQLGRRETESKAESKASAEANRFSTGLCVDLTLLTGLWLSAICLSTRAYYVLGYQSYVNLPIWLEPFAVQGLPLVLVTLVCVALMFFRVRSCASANEQTPVPFKFGPVDGFQASLALAWIPLFFGLARLGNSDLTSLWMEAFAVTCRGGPCCLRNRP